LRRIDTAGQKFKAGWGVWFTECTATVNGAQFGFNFYYAIATPHFGGGAPGVGSNLTTVPDSVRTGLVCDSGRVCGTSANVVHPVCGVDLRAFARTIGGYDEQLIKELNGCARSGNFNGRQSSGAQI